MGVSLNHPADGTVGWYSAVDGNWSTIEGQYVARQEGDTSVVTVSGTTNETVLMTNTTVPANALAAGVVLPVFACGSITIPAGTMGLSPTWRLRWGGISGSILLAWAPFVYTNTGGASINFGWTLVNRIIGVSAGSTGSAETGGWASSVLSPASGAGASFVAYQSATTTIDTTTSQNLVWTIQSSVAGVSTSQRLMLTNRG
jgi:hypothetical protein